MFSFVSSVICVVVGVLLVASAFYIQKKEDRMRIPGFYTEATVVANVPKKGKAQNLRDVTFEFTKDFKVIHCTNSYCVEEAESWREGRHFLIVYDETQDKVFCNPMKAYRKKQAVCIAVGGIVILVGIQWSILAAGLLF